MIKIGLDTSCLNAKRKNKFLNKIEELEKQNKVLLVTSTVNEKEQYESNFDEFWKNKYLEVIRKRLKIPEVARWDISSYDEAVYADLEKSIELESLFPDPKDFYDLWLLQTCISGGCDFFLTLNSRDFIYNGKKEKIEMFGIKIRIPDQQFIDEILKI